jgi:hypothetical protein
MFKKPSDFARKKDWPEVDSRESCIPELLAGSLVRCLHPVALVTPLLLPVA